MLESAVPYWFWKRYKDCATWLKYFFIDNLRNIEAGVKFVYINRREKMK
jgi:hypothetical protein